MNKKRTRSNGQKRQSSPARMPSMVRLTGVQTRRMLQSAIGDSYNGKRKMYEELGYPSEDSLGIDEFAGVYSRQDIAGTIVDLPADSTWQGGARAVVEGDRDSEFSVAFDDIARKSSLFSFLADLDKAARIGRFSVMLLGFNDGRKLSTEVGRATKLSFLRVFDERAVDVVLEDDETSARFGLPKEYKIDLDFGISEKRNDRIIHWSRIVHCATDTISRKIYGRSPLRRVYNRLLDIEKTLGGSAEAIWRLVYQGLVVEAKDGYELDDDTSAARQERYEAFVHGTMRVLELEGFNVEQMGGQVVDATATIFALVRFAGSATQIPWQMLIGAERGDVANKQDQTTLQKTIDARRDHFADPILFELLDRLSAAGVLLYPAGTIRFAWTPLFSSTRSELSEIAESVARAMQAATGGLPDMIMSPEDFRERFIDPIVDAK